MKRTTGKFDFSGQEIFTGEKVLKAWGAFGCGSDSKTTYQVHTITEKPAHMMSNGKMHDDGGGVIYCIGECYNFWEGKEVKKLSDAEYQELAVDEDRTFFFNEDNKPVYLTDQHFFGLTDEQWEEEKERRRKEFEELFFGQSFHDIFEEK